MSMSVDGSTSSINYKELFSQALKGKDLDGTESGSSVVLNGDSVTISVRDPESGETVARTIPSDKAVLASVVLGAAQSMYTCAAAVDDILDILGAYAESSGFTPPEEGASKPAVPQMTLAQVGEYLQKLGDTTTEEVTNGAILSASSESETTFFDIYALMALLQQVGQQEREAARDLKYAELNTEVASIHAQASKQREAGVLGAIVSGITLCAQLAMTTVSVVKSASTIKSSYNTGAAMDANLAQSKYDSLQAQNKTDNTATVKFQKMQMKTMGTGAEQKYNTALTKAGVPESRNAYLKAQTNETKVTQEQTAIKNTEQAKVTKCENEIAALKSNGAKDPNAAAKVKDLETQKADSLKKIETADSKIKTAQDETATAKKNYVNSLDKAQTIIDDEYGAASSHTKLAEQEHIQKPTKATAKDVTTARQDQKELSDASKLMSARVASDKCEIGETASADKITAAKDNVTLSNKMLAEDPAFRSAQSFPMMMLYQSLPNMIGNMGQSCAQMASQLASAEGTEKQADQKTAEMHREETNALFSQAQDLITSARECCKAIFQAESQSVEQIIRA